MKPARYPHKKTSLSASGLWLSLLLMGGGLGFIAACENNEDVKLAEAQDCLDKATAGAGANRCLEIVGNIAGAEASAIRCSGKYLQRSVTESSFVSAYRSLSVTPAANTSQVLNLVSYLTFTGNNPQTGANAITDANYVFTECQKANSKGMIMLASATKMGSEVFALFGGAPPSDPSVLAPTLAAQIQNGGFAGSQTESQVGSAAIAAQSAYCSGNVTDSICTTLNKAVNNGGGSPQGVGAALRGLLAPTP